MATTRRMKCPPNSRTQIQTNPGELISVVVTSIGSAAFTIYDNIDGDTSGDILYRSLLTPALGPVLIFGYAENGIVLDNPILGSTVIVNSNQ